MLRNSPVLNPQRILRVRLVLEREHKQLTRKVVGTVEVVHHSKLHLEQKGLELAKSW